MHTDLKNHIRAALSGSSSSAPVATDTLAKGHQRRRVEAALMEMYQAREVACCKITKAGRENVVWWLAAQIGPFKSPHQLNKESRAKMNVKAVKPQAKSVVCRMSPLSIEVKNLITAHPGLTIPEVYEKLNKQAAERHRVRVAIGNLASKGHIRTEGVERQYRYYPEEAA